FVKGTWPGHYDIGKDTDYLLQMAFEGPSFDFTVYTGQDIASIVKKHSLNVGPTFLPPKWAFSTWRWRDNHSNLKQYYDGTPVSAPYNSQVVEDILMMKALDIPFGAYWVDRPWAKGDFGYDDFEWDPERFPEAEKMLTWLNKKDIPFMLWIAPWVSGDMKDYAVEHHYNMPQKYEEDPSKNIALLDLTNPEAVEWWQYKGLARVLKQGVRGFKLDRSEEIVPESRDILTYDQTTTREIRNEYPVLYIKAVNEICQEIHPDDFMIFPRAGYTHSSRYGGFWGGDIGSPQEGLRTAIIAAQRSSLIGFPIWGSDIGGYWQGALDREVTARWLAFGCFTPLMEVGPTEDRAFWDMKNEPHYDSELLAVWRTYAIIHTNLMDYSYNAAKEARETGMPLIRPLLMVYPDQKEAWNDWQSFMYGPDILVSAIWKKGTSSRNVWLPAGEEWIDAWDSTKTYQGGQTVEVQTPMYKIPVFIRKRTGLSLGDLNGLYKASLDKVKEKPDLKKVEKAEGF
ncbi:MAG TPA: glycoside hydrolase family 31 protein, partial [Bacteroidales bacterium]|nr:glycoside hydrolase family 31 protein [Bacteroidales bacterium]